MKQKNGFSGQIGFVFAAAGSAVGVGNLWRFPYLAAKDGGGLFLILYLVLVLFFDTSWAAVLSAFMSVNFLLELAVNIVLAPAVLRIVTMRRRTA